jgi:hypothetical protein
MAGGETCFNTTQGAFSEDSHIFPRGMVNDAVMSVFPGEPS